LPVVPGDARAEEVSGALLFGGAIGVALLLELADLFDTLVPFVIPGDVQSPPPQLLLGVVGLAWAYDRYSQRGEYGAALARGLSRLLDRDLQREAAAESASFLVGYVLGLPSMPFVPSASRALEMIETLGEQMEGVLPRPARLVDRVLIWQLAPVVAEAQEYDDLLVSEPGLPMQLLRAARRKQATLGVDALQGGWTADDDEARVRWAYAEAKRLLKRYSGTRAQLQTQMAAGVSVGDCVVLIERELRNQWAAV